MRLTSKTITYEQLAKVIDIDLELRKWIGSGGMIDRSCYINTGRNVTQT